MNPRVTVAGAGHFQPPLSRSSSSTCKVTSTCITYNGGTATRNSIYASSDLRSDSWHHVAMTLTTTTWTVYVDGGVTAQVSGSATGMTSAWTDLIVNGDMGGGRCAAIGTATSLIQSVSGKRRLSP